MRYGGKMKDGANRTTDNQDDMVSVKISKTSKEMLDEVKRRTGRSLVHILNSAVEEYATDQLDAAAA